MIRKLFLTLFLGLSLICNSFAQEKAKTYPEQNIAPFLGLDDTSAPTQVKDFRASDIQNITLNVTGQASKRNGYAWSTLLDTNFNNGVSDDNFEAVTSGYEFYKSDGTRTILSTCGNKIFKVTVAGVKTDITSGVTITEGQNYQFSWITALDYAIGTNFQDAPIKTDGTTTSALSFTGLSNAITKAKCVIWWKNYLIFGNTVENSVSRTTRIRWSNVGTIQTWSDDDFRDIATLGGQQIEAMATLYDDLYIFLTDSIYKVSLVGGDDLIKVTKVSEGIGCIAKNSVKTIGIGNSEGIVFLSRDKTINYLDGVKVTEISTLISGVMDDLSAIRLPYAVAVDDRVNLHYYLAVTTGSVSTNNLLLDFHYGIGEWSKHTQIDANAIWIANDTNTNQRVYFGNYNSFLYVGFDPDKYSDVAGEVGVFDSRDVIDTQTASGLTVLYDTSADFTDVTGAIVRITSGTGADTESVIAATTSSGIVVVSASFTATGTSVYSIGDIDAYYTTKWYDVGSSPLRKNFGELFFWSTTETNADITVTYATDFVNTMTTSTVDLQADGSLWGTAIWGTATWGGISSSLSRIPLNVSGRFIKVRWRENEIDEPMTLQGYNFIYWDLDYF